MAERRSYPVAPQGDQLCVCADIEDLGYKPVKWEGKTKMKPRVALYFLSEFEDENGRNISIREEFTDSYHESARLRKFIDAWRGARKPDSYYATFDREKLIGACAVLSIVHNVTPGRTYANVVGVKPSGGEAIAIPDWFVRKRDRQPQQQGGAVRSDETPF